MGGGGSELNGSIRLHYSPLVSEKSQLQLSLVIFRDLRWFRIDVAFPFSGTDLPQSFLLNPATVGATHSANFKG